MKMISKAVSYILSASLILAPVAKASASESQPSPSQPSEAVVNQITTAIVSGRAENLELDLKPRKFSREQVKDAIQAASKSTPVQFVKSIGNIFLFFITFFVDSSVV
jgi:hypothetical protein